MKKVIFVLFISFTFVGLIHADSYYVMHVVLTGGTERIFALTDHPSMEVNGSYAVITADNLTVTQLPLNAIDHITVISENSEASPSSATRTINLSDTVVIEHKSVEPQPSSINEVTVTQDNILSFRFIDGNNVEIFDGDVGDRIDVYSVNGMKQNITIYREPSLCRIDVSSLIPGVYIIRTKNQTFKFKK